MINYDTIIESEVYDVVGFQQNLNPSGKQLSAPSLVSESGLFIDEVHSLLNIDNIERSAPNIDQYSYTAWVAGTYYQGDKRSHSGSNWIVNVSSTTEVPGAGSDWRVYPPFEEWMERIKKRGIKKAIGDFESKKLKDKTTDNIMDKLSLFEGTQSLSELTNLSDEIVGFEINPVDSKYLSVQIDEIGVHFEGNATFNIYIFHSSKKTPVYTQEIAYTGDGSNQWIPVSDIMLDYGTPDVGGSWYMVYDMRDISVKPINRAVNWRTAPCRCDRANYQRYNTWSKYINIMPFKNADSLSTPTMFDIESNSYTYETNYGLNIKLTVRCDLTQFIIDNRDNFKHVLKYAIGMEFLREMAMNSNLKINRLENNIDRMGMLYELDGNTQGRPTGVGYEYSNHMKALNIDLSGIDVYCLKCKSKGIRFK